MIAQPKRKLTRSYYHYLKPSTEVLSFDNTLYVINLINDTINAKDLRKLAKWLKTNPRLTKGNLTLDFENLFAEWLGSKYAVFVNSGSSANLIMIYTLIAQGKLKIGDSVVVPALSWATDLAPIIQLGLKPILCDCNLTNLALDLKHLEKILKEDSPKAVLLVSILGFSPPMQEVINLCDKYDVILLEDNCESLGSKYGDKKLGTFGLMSTTSFYFGHHISTIEGGMVFTNNKDTYNTLLSLRSHGWSRDWSPEYRELQEDIHGIKGITSLYSFYYPGFNLRATDLQAFLGLLQIEKLDKIIVRRHGNFRAYMRHLKLPWKPKEVNGSYTSNFAFPIITEHRDKIISALKEENIETRPLVSGSMSLQPMFLALGLPSHCPNAERIHANGLYLPNHPGLSRRNIRFVCEVINKAAASL